MARVCSRSGCVNVPNNPRQQFSSGTPGAIAPSREQIDAIMRGNNVRNTRMYLENDQQLTPAMQPFEQEARAQMAQPVSVPLPQETTIAQKLQGMGQPSFDPIEQYYKRQFATETVPQLAERFTGSKESSAFTGALGSAGSQLNTNLALLRSEFDSRLRDQMIKMAAIQGLNPSQNQAAPSWWDTASTALRLGAGLVGGPYAGPLIEGGINLYNQLRNRSSNASNQSSVPNISQAIAPDQQLLGSRLSSGYATPQDIQRFQAVTGLGGSAATDFANTFRQPGSQASMMDQNLNRFKRFTNASPGSALQYLGIRS